MYLDIREIEKNVSELHSKINNGTEEEYRTQINGNLFFKESNANYLPGTYVYASEDGYHIDAVGDRGGIVCEKKFKDIEDVYFELCWDLVSSISINYASRNRVDGKDWRRIMFSKRLSLLENMGIQYYQRGKTVIDNILLENPYNDELLG